MWSKGEELQYKPIIYYIDPKTYVHIEFTKLARKAEKLLSTSIDHDVGNNLVEVKRFLQKVRDLGREANRGLSLYEAVERSKYEIPFIPVKRPEKNGISILKLLYLEPAAGQSIDKLTRLFLTNEQGKKQHQIDYQTINKTRSMLFHHIVRLESLGMLNRTRLGRRVSIAPTELGKIFGHAFADSLRQK